VALTDAAIEAALDALDPAGPAADYTRTAEGLRVELTRRIAAATATRDVAGLVLLLRYAQSGSAVAALMGVTKQHLLQTVKPRAPQPLPEMDEPAARRRLRRAVAAIDRLNPLLDRARDARTDGVQRILAAAHGEVSNDAVTAATGVGRGTVNSIRRKAEQAGVVPVTHSVQRQSVTAKRLKSVPDEVLAAEAARRWPDRAVPGQASACG
jgi:hypothetical protein